MSHVCPWWGGYFLDNPLRRLLHDPEKIVGPYLRPGMTVMLVGGGIGFFAIALSNMVGEPGPGDRRRSPAADARCAAAAGNLYPDIPPLCCNIWWATWLGL